MTLSAVGVMTSTWISRLLAWPDLSKTSQILLLLLGVISKPEV